jgi:hypothetical protein
LICAFSVLGLGSSVNIRTCRFEVRMWNYLIEQGDGLAVCYENQTHDSFLEACAAADRIAGACLGKVLRIESADFGQWEFMR